MLPFIVYIIISTILVCVFGFIDGFYKIVWDNKDYQVMVYIFLFMLWPIILLVFIVAIPIYIIYHIILFSYNCGNKFNKNLTKSNP